MIGPIRPIGPIWFEMIEAQNLTKYFGAVCALGGVSLQVGRGEVVGLLGPNGSGKTTLMRVLAGFFPPTTGTVRIAGFDAGAQSIEVRRRVGYLPENAVLYPEMRVRAFLEFCGAARRLAAPALARRVDAVLHDFGLNAYAGRLIRTLSKGFRQRLGLAQALLHEPEVLILDEPSVGLDPRQAVEMRQLIAQRKGKTTILWSTHVLSEVDAGCDRVVILDRGRVVAQDTPSALARQAADAELVLLRLTGDTPVQALLQSLTGVELIAARRDGGGVQEITVRVVATAGKREELAARLVREGYGLLEIRPLKSTLEDRFIDLLAAEH